MFTQRPSSGQSPMARKIPTKKLIPSISRIKYTQSSQYVGNRLRYWYATNTYSLYDWLQDGEVAFRCINEGVKQDDMEKGAPITPTQNFGMMELSNSEDTREELMITPSVSLKRAITEGSYDVFRILFGVSQSTPIVGGNRHQVTRGAVTEPAKKPEKKIANKKITSIRHRGRRS